MKKFLAVIIALTMATALCVSTFAADSYTAYIGFADSSWSHSGFQPDTASVEITGDGQYVIETDQFAGSTDIIVLVVDFVGMNADNPAITATVDSVEIDGAQITLDSGKVLSGDLEGNGNYRLEIYNEYGAGTASDPPIDNATAVNSTIKVTFTVSGMGGAETPAAEAETPTAETETPTIETEVPVAEAETPAAEAESAAPATGIALAVIPAVIALGAAAVSKKH